MKAAQIADNLRRMGTKDAKAGADAIEAEVRAREEAEQNVEKQKSALDTYAKTMSGLHEEIAELKEKLASQKEDDDGREELDRKWSV